jgi:hypothetical protein
MASCGYGVDLLDGLSLGFSGKFLMDDLDGDQKIGGAGDVGAACSFYGTGLTLGCSVLNLGSMSGATLPIEGRIGASYLIAFLDSGFIMSSNVRNKFLISVDGTAPFQDLNAAQASIGGEFWYHDIVALRLGQQLVRTPGLTGLSGFSAGVGVRDGPVQLDYAFATRGDLGNINMVSLLVKL